MYQGELHSPPSDNKIDVDKVIVNSEASFNNEIILSSQALDSRTLRTKSKILTYVLFTDKSLCVTFSSHYTGKWSTGRSHSAIAAMQA